MEAMSQGKPVVATNVGGLPEVVVDGGTGLLVEADDPAALAHAALRLLGEPELGRQMGLRGRQRAKQCFDKREMVARVKEVYADLLREEADATGGRK
jgi:glycosyltransferase involved in cell wall biosynthesis